MSGSAMGGALTTNQYGSELHWETAYVPFYLNPGGKHGLNHDDVEAAIVEAAAQWREIDGSWLELTYEGRTDVETHTSGDGVQAVFFLDEWEQDPALLALTYTYSYEDGAITHFDIAINTDGHEWSTDGSEDSNDLQNAMVHEFGHAVGLDHSDDPEASMFSETFMGELTKRDLVEDDVVTYASLYDGYFPYPETGLGCSTAGGGSTGSAFGPSGGGGGAYPSFQDSAGCSIVGGGGHALALIAGLLVAFRRRNDDEVPR